MACNLSNECPIDIIQMASFFTIVSNTTSTLLFFNCPLGFYFVRIVSRETLGETAPCLKCCSHLGVVSGRAEVNG